MAAENDLKKAQIHSDHHNKTNLEWTRVHRYNKRHEPRLDDFRGKGPFNISRYNLMDTLYHLYSFISLIFRLNTFVVSLLAVGATCTCYYLNWTFDLSQLATFLSAGIFFPVSFGIQFSFNRRERILLDISSLRASVFTLYALSREWPPHIPPKDITNLDTSSSEEPHEEDKLQIYGIHEGEHCEKMKRLLSDLLVDISKYISHNDPQNVVIYAIYAKFDEILHLLESIRIADTWINSVISRAYQYVRYMINDFERIRTNTDYRAPSTFRGFSYVMLTLFPILYAPSFAKIGKDLSHIGPAIYAALVITLIFVALNNIMEGLEDSFDGIGADDLNVAIITEPILFMYKPIVSKGTSHHHSDIRISKILKKREIDKDTVGDTEKDNSGNNSKKKEQKKEKNMK